MFQFVDLVSQVIFHVQVFRVRVWCDARGLSLDRRLLECTVFEGHLFSNNNNSRSFFCSPGRSHRVIEYRSCWEQ